MTQVRYRDLTEYQHYVLEELGQINGCGTRSGILNVPDWSFTASCYHHDFNYWLGGSEEDRAKADWQFYQAMKEDAESAPWWKRHWYAMMAWIYYRAVRYYSWRLWPEGEMRTLEDLERLVAEYDASTS